MNDIFQHRMEGTLEAMARVPLLCLPTDKPWTLEALVANSWNTCCKAAQVGGGV